MMQFLARQLKQQKPESRTYQRWAVPFVAATLGLGSVFLSGCAHSRTAGDALPSPASLGEVLQQDLNSPSPPQIVIQNHAIYVRGVKLKNTQFDLPIAINSRVEYWIDYFCGRGRGYFSKYLERSEYFVPYIKPLLKQNGMPEDLVYLAMIESGFNNLARSRARAVGPWQFMSLTGKRYGLMVNWWVDERRDIRKSTLAAVGYLRDLYGMFNSWELAAAAYNGGEAKVARAIQRFGTRDFWEISRHRFLRPETRDYVPKIIAAALIAKNRTQFGFEEAKAPTGADEVVAGDGEVVKLTKDDKPSADKPLDPETYGEESDDPADSAAGSSDDDGSRRPGITPATLTVPADDNGDAGEDNVTAAVQQVAKPVPTPHVTRSGEVGGEQLSEFEVRSPADLLKIARAAGLSYQTVKSLNPELLRWCTPPTIGAYRIKLPASVKDRFLATYNHEAFPRKVKFMTYKVRRGETLARIAQHFGIKVDPISDLNGMSPRVPLRSGIRVLLPMPNDRSRNLASLDVRDPPEHRHHRRVRHRRRHYERVSYKRRAAARHSRGRST